MSANEKPYSIGSDRWPGVSKLIEEMGEVQQVLGKLLGTGGQPAHWDGSDLRVRLHEELADLQAAMMFVIETNDLDGEAILARSNAKFLRFKQWHAGDGSTP